MKTRKNDIVTIRVTQEEKKLLKEKELAMWLNESKNGKKYFSVKFSEPYQAEVEAGYGHKPKEDKDDMPF